MQTSCLLIVSWYLFVDVWCVKNWSYYIRHALTKSLLILQEFARNSWWEILERTHKRWNRLCPRPSRLEPWDPWAGGRAAGNEFTPEFRTDWQSQVAGTQTCNDNRGRIKCTNRLAGSILKIDEESIRKVDIYLKETRYAKIISKSFTIKNTAVKIYFLQQID